MPQEIKDWATLIVAALSILGTAWALIRSPARLAEAKVDELAGHVDQQGDRLVRLDERLARVEGEMAHLPDKDAVHRLEMSISEMRGEMRAMAERMASVSETSRRLQDWLLEQGK